MNSILTQLEDRVREAMAFVGAEGDPLVRPAQDVQFGDYQSNAAMSAAKRLGRKPRDVAADIVQRLNVTDFCEPPEIAGPGFINFRLKPAFLKSYLERVQAPTTAGQDRLGIDPTDRPQTIVVDLSSPNLAKEMHVGHLRSTVIGDCLCRMLEFQGHIVHRENHVGDWGTQFGMLLAHLRRERPEVVDRPEALEIKDLESFYVEAKSRFDADEEFKRESRETVVALQRGDPVVRKIWQSFCEESLRHCHALYRRLNVRLVDRGESFYTDLMDDVIARLEKLRASRGSEFVRISEGALCLFMDGFKTREGEDLPLIVRKADGGFNYATSDLATLLHRIETLKAQRILYVVGISQKQHFEMVFAAARQAGWVPSDVTLTHVGFGNVLAASGKPFKTREGGTVKLKELLDEAVTRARRVVDAQTEPGGMDEDDKNRIAETVGLGAVKYFDLSHGLSSDYRFDFETILSLEGNTAPYMLYAYARTCSIHRKAESGAAAEVHRSGIASKPPVHSAPPSALIVEHPAEIALAKVLCQFAETLESATNDLRPNLLTDYLYDLAKAFSRFYDKKLGVRVIDASPESLRQSRLRLCELTARTLKLGLNLLGIETVEQM